MRRIEWSSGALDDFDRAVEFIAVENPAAALRVASRVRATIEGLADIPTGRRSRAPGAYEKIVTGLPYIVVYGLGDGPAGAVSILRIIHGARDWPEGGWPA